MTMATCGNKNLHYIPPTEPKDVAEKVEGAVLVCVLDAKHTGDHQAPYPDGDKEHEGQTAFWSDAANVPINDRKYDKKKGAAKESPKAAPVKEK
jgi:hypothetical protein